MAHIFDLQAGYQISIYVISTMIAISGISLGIGYAFNEKRFKEFGKEELYQSIINGALVGGLILLFMPAGIVGSAIRSMTLVNGTSMTCSSYMNTNPAICLAYDYLAGTGSYTFMGLQHQSILYTSTETITSLIGLNTLIGTISSIKLNLAVVQLSFSYVFLPIINEIQYIIKIMSTVAIGALVQAAVLSFVAVGTLGFMLPVGLALRAFYPTRKLGGFFIAVSIGLYVVLPLTYIFNMTISASFVQSASDAGLTKLTSAASGIENQVFSTSSYANATKENGLIGSLSNAVGSLSTDVTVALNKILSAVAYFIVYTFVLPAFSLIVTGISIKELAELLGSEASFGKFYMLG